MKKLLNEFLNLFYPNLCLICSNSLITGEKQICFSCLAEIPRTSYHLTADNPVEKRFWGKVPVFRGTSFYFFQKGSPFQKLLHELKYRGNKEVGVIMGKFAASELNQSPDFNSVDIILPVPLHPKKLAKRGYNQSECICDGLAEVLGKPVDVKTLIRVKENKTQTRKNVFERYENTVDLFKVTDKEILKGKHVLLVDDVLTTGSTLEACISALLDIPGIRISIFTLAVA